MSGETLFNALDNQLSDSYSVMEGAKILLAVNDLATARNIKKFVGLYGPKEIVVVYTGKDALKAISDAETNFDVLLCDWDISEVPGVEICWYLKEELGLSNTYVALLSSITSGSREDEAKAAGVDKLVIKSETLSAVEPHLKGLERR